MTPTITITETAKEPELVFTGGFGNHLFREPVSPGLAPMHWDANEKELLSKVAKGDIAAFTCLYERYRRKVYFIAWKLLKNEAECEDVIQEVFTRIWVNRGMLGTIENFNSWMNTLIRNHLYNCLRKKANQDSFISGLTKHDINNGDTESDQIELRELQAQIKQAMNSLTTQQKKVFQLSRIEGFKHSEIAGILGISIETVKKHVIQAIGKIKICLAKK